VPQNLSVPRQDAADPPDLSALSSKKTSVLQLPYSQSFTLWNALNTAKSWLPWMVFLSSTRNSVTNAWGVIYIKPVMPDRGRTVLHVSPDSALAESRTRALASIGYEVVRAETVLAAWFEISMGRCGILLLCHKLDRAGRCTLAEYFHKNCPDPYIVAILAHEADDYPPQAHARVLFSKEHGPLLTVMRQRPIAA
jgi:hypothetical protein